MKTFFIDLDNLSLDTSKELMGFVLTMGLNFRKIDRHFNSSTGRTLVVELSSRVEEKALKRFLNERSLDHPIVIGNENKAILDGKKIGTLSQVNSTEGLPAFYNDSSTGKKFIIVK